MSPINPVELENVHEQLAVLVPGFIGKHQVHVIIQIAPALAIGGTAGQPQIYAVIHGLVSAIKAAVDVEHGGVAFVHVLRSEAEHVIVEPVGGHGFMPVTRDFVQSAVVSRAAGQRIGGISIEAEVPAQNDWPVIVIELAGEEVSSGEAIVLRSVMAVVLVRGNGVAAEPVVLRNIERQTVVVAEQNRLAIASDDQLGRNGAVECPDRV